MSEVTGPRPLPRGRLLLAHQMCIDLAGEMEALALHAGCSRVALDGSASEEDAEWFRVEAIFDGAASALQIAATTLHDKFNCDGGLGPADEPLRVDTGRNWSRAEPMYLRPMPFFGGGLGVWGKSFWDPSGVPGVYVRPPVEPSAATPAAPTIRRARARRPSEGHLPRCWNQAQRDRVLRELAMLAPAQYAEGTCLLARMEQQLSSSSSTSAAPEPKCGGKSKSKGGYGDHPKGKGKKAEGGYKFYPKGKGKESKRAADDM